MDIVAIAVNLFRQTRREGVSVAFGNLLSRAHTYWMEWRLGIHTDEFITADNLGYNGECASYAPVPYSSMRVILSELSMESDDVFLDIGCGMGRLVVLAAGYPIKRAIGVERSPALADIAHKNLRTARHLRCWDLDIVTMNAAQYVIPNDVSVIFMFNPFTGAVLNAVLNNIWQSLQEAPRRLTLACLLQRGLPFDVQLRATPWLRRSCEMPVGGSICSFYRAANTILDQGNCSTPSE